MTFPTKSTLSLLWSTLKGNRCINVDSVVYKKLFKREVRRNENTYYEIKSRTL